VEQQYTSSLAILLNLIFLKLHGLVLQRLLLKGWDYWLLVLWKLDIP